MKRAIEAYTTMYIVLHKLYIGKILETNPAIEKDLLQASAHVADDLAEKCQKRNKSGVQEFESDTIGALKSTCFLDVQKNFDSPLTHQSKFLKNFMIIFENLLMFIRASRLGLWNLHLQSLHHLSKYLFAFDVNNYAQVTPVYLTQMFELKDHNPDTWAFLEPIKRRKLPTFKENTVTSKLAVTK